MIDRRQPKTLPWSRDLDTHVDDLVSAFQKLICFIGQYVPQLELRAVVRLINVDFEQRSRVQAVV